MANKKKPPGADQVARARNGGNNSHSNTNIQLPTVSNISAEDAGNFAYAESDTDAINDPSLAHLGMYGDWISQVRTGEDAFRERPPLMAYMDHLFVEGTINVIYGSPGELKSMLTACMLAHISAGRPFPNIAPTAEGMRAKQFGVAQSNTLFLDYDMGQRPSDDRAQAIMAKLGKGPDWRKFMYMSFAHPRIELGTHQKIVEFCAFLNHFDIKVIGMDGLSTILPSGAKMVDETSRQVLDSLKSVSDKTGAAITAIHYPNKAGMGTPQTQGLDLYGNQMILAACDTIWRAQRVLSEGQRTNTVNVFNTKNRLGDELPPWAVEFYSTPREDNPTLMSEAWFVGKAPKLSRQEQTDTQIWQVLRQVLADETMRQTELVGGIIEVWPETFDTKPPGVNKTRDAIRRFAEGQDWPLSCQPNGHDNAMQYRLLI